MPNLVDVTYAQTGQSISTNGMGMREIQSRAFEARNAKYLLLKAPPTSRNGDNTIKFLNFESQDIPWIQLTKLTAPVSSL